MLLIAGKDDGHQSFLDEKVKNLNLTDRVFFIGELQGVDKVKFLSGGDLFVLPSHNENFGNVYLESLACGTPVVASWNTPWSEVEEHGCGKYVENSTEAMSAAMWDMMRQLNDQCTKEEFAAACRKYASNFSWQMVAVKFHKYFSDILAK